MNIKDSQRLIKLAMKARVPYMMVGHSGIGKSQITGQIAKEVFPGHRFVSVFASQCDVGDFIGIPDVISVEMNDEHGNKKTTRVTSWARPEWMPYEPCVIFLDELNNARPDVESAMLQLVLEKRIHTHSLHPDSYICAAINPSNAEYTTANTMSAALVKRFIVIPFEPEASEFIQWGEESKRVNSKLVQFLKHMPVITGVEKKLDTLIKLEPCPRLLTEAVSKMFNIMEKEGLFEDRTLIQDVLVTSIGANAAAAFLGWLDVQDKPVTFAEIMNDPDKALKRYNTFYKDLRTDLCASTTENILNGIKEIHEELVGKVEYKTSILEYDRKADEELVDKCIKELNVIVKNGLYGQAEKLNNLISFLKEVPSDVMFQICHSIILMPPHKDKLPGVDDKLHHEQQIKRFEAFNTLVFYLLRDDLIKGHKGLNKRFIATVKEVEKNKSKLESND